LNDSGHVATLFASTNKGFEYRGALNQTYAYGTLKYHIVEDELVDLASNLPKKIETSLTAADDSLLVGFSDTTRKQVIMASQGDNGVLLNYGYKLRARVQQTIPCSNGVIHVIDTVLIPPSNYALAYLGYNLTQFVNLTDDTEVTEDILTSGGITVFACVDAIVNGTNVFSLSPEERKGFVRYHLVKSVVYSTDFITSQNFTSVQGQPINVTKNGNQIKVNGEAVVSEDVQMRNGVLHVLNGLITPSTGAGSKVSPKATADEDDVNGNGDGNGNVNKGIEKLDYDTNSATTTSRNFHLEMVVVLLVTVLLYV